MNVGKSLLYLFIFVVKIFTDVSRDSFMGVSVQSKMFLFPPGSIKIPFYQTGTRCRPVAKVF